MQPGTRRSCQRPRCLVKLAPGRAWEGPLTAWNQEEDLLFRYWKCSVDVCSAHIEDVVVLTDAGRIETTLDARGKIVPWTPRYGLARVLEAEAIDPEVTLYLAGWGLPVDSDVLVAQLPEVLVELVTQRMWHTVMWRWTYPGGLLLQNVFDLIPVHMQRNAMVRRKARRGHPIDPRQPDPEAAPVAREFFVDVVHRLRQWGPTVLAGQGSAQLGDEDECMELEVKDTVIGMDRLQRALGVKGAPCPGPANTIRTDCCMDSCWAPCCGTVPSRGPR